MRPSFTFRRMGAGCFSSLCWHYCEAPHASPQGLTVLRMDLRTLGVYPISWYVVNMRKKKTVFDGRESRTNSYPETYKFMRFIGLMDMRTLRLIVSDCCAFFLTRLSALFHIFILKRSKSYVYWT